MQRGLQSNLDLGNTAPRRLATTGVPRPETQMAPVDISLCTGLFRPVDKKANRHVGSRRKVRYQQRWFLLDSAWRLGPDDLALFLVLVAAAAKTYNGKRGGEQSRFLGVVLNHDTKEEDWQRILPKFEHSDVEKRVGGGELQGRRAMLSRGNWIYLSPRMNVLVSEVGLAKSKSAYTSITDSLGRLSQVTMTGISGPEVNARSVRRVAGDDLVSYVSDEADKRIHILLNKELATPILGRPYVPVPVSETRQLGGVARLLHLHLCSELREFQDHSNADKFELTDLARVIYADRDEENRFKTDQPGEVIRDWCDKLKQKGLGDTETLRSGERRKGPSRIADLPGWEVTWSKDHERTVSITRPASSERRRIPIDAGHCTADTSPPPKAIALTSR